MDPFPLLPVTTAAGALASPLSIPRDNSGCLSSQSGASFLRNGSEAGYEEWLRQELNGIIAKKGIRNNNASVWLNADGRDELAIQPGDRVEICRSAHRTRLIRVRDDGFLNVLRAKLSE